MNRGGFFHTEDATAYKFGDANLAAVELQPNGHWDDYLPNTEDQTENGYDPFSCASEGTTTCIEILIRRLFKSSPEYSERFLAHVVGTRLTMGADPHVVAEHARKLGIPFEEQWPSKGIPTFDEYHANPPAKIYEYARQFLSEWHLGHDIVPSNPTAMMNALKYSPLGVSVRFDREENGIYRYRSFG